MKELSGCNRVEVIDCTRSYEDGGGRCYVMDHRGHPPLKVSIDMQDDGRTLKVFIEPVSGGDTGNG